MNNGLNFSSELWEADAYIWTIFKVFLWHILLLLKLFSAIQSWILQYSQQRFYSHKYFMKLLYLCGRDVTFFSKLIFFFSFHAVHWVQWYHIWQHRQSKKKRKQNMDRENCKPQNTRQDFLFSSCHHIFQLHVRRVLKMSNSSWRILTGSESGYLLLMTCSPFAGETSLDLLWLYFFATYSCWVFSGNYLFVTWLQAFCSTLLCHFQ